MMPASYPEVQLAKQPNPSPEKIGVLLANLGTPNGTDYWSVRKYLSEFLSDPRVIDLPRWLWQPILQVFVLARRPVSSGAAYKSIWNNDRNESPLMTITRAQTEKLSKIMTTEYRGRIIVDFCMRYGNPSIRSRVDDLIEQGCTKILFFPLYPQYAGATTATANDRFYLALRKVKSETAVRTVPAYFDQPLYVDALGQSVERAYEKLPVKPDILVASYHGMPVRYVTAGDPYSSHCEDTTQLMAERLGWSGRDIITTYQSKFGRDKWLTPATVEEVARLAKQGKRNIAIISPAFSADCIETLEEIQEEIRESFMAAGGQTFTYIPCLNADAAHMNALAHIVHENLAGWVE